MTAAAHVALVTNSHYPDLTTGMFADGTLVNAAADGSRLFGTYSGFGTGRVLPNPKGRCVISGTLAVTGGTDRLGATGTLFIEGIQVTDSTLVDFPTESALRMKGTIPSVGARSRP